MLFLIISLTVVFVAAGVVLYLVLKKSTGRTDEFLGEAIEAWQHKDLSETDFAVEFVSGSVTDLFDTFHRAGSETVLSQSQNSKCGVENEQKLDAKDLTSANLQSENQLIGKENTISQH